MAEGLQEGVCLMCGWHQGIGLSAWQDEQARAAVDASPDGVCSKMLLYLLNEDTDDGEYGNVKRLHLTMRWVRDVVWCLQETGNPLHCG